MEFSLKVNGANHRVDLDGDTPLLWVLRDVLGLTGTKFGCGIALCGACTVHVDGVPRRSCVSPIDSLRGAKVTTIEAIDKTPRGNALQQAWLDLDRCNAVTVSQGNPHVRRCASVATPAGPMPTSMKYGWQRVPLRTYQRIRAAIHRAAKEMAMT
jgi:isoquinoline 1-oxidoreductase alpha subunit